jgi:endonuclease YncB( thermonuclease family)
MRQFTEPRHCRSRMGHLARVLLCLVLLIVPAAWATDTLTGKVVKIADRDALTLLTPEKRQIKIRLAEIDTLGRASPTQTEPPLQVQKKPELRRFSLPVQR